MVFGIETMFSSFETIFSKPETMVDVPETMVNAVGEPAEIVQLTQPITLTKRGITMTQRVRIADRLKTQSAEQLVTMAGAVITGLTNNPLSQPRRST